MGSEHWFQGKSDAELLLRKSLCCSPTNNMICNKAALVHPVLPQLRVLLLPPPALSSLLLMEEFVQLCSDLEQESHQGKTNLPEKWLILT